MTKISDGRLRKCFVIGLSLLTLAACGGGGGGAPSTPTPAPSAIINSATAEDLNSASYGKFAVLFKPESKEVVLRWNDSFTTESGYRVERQTDGATWELQEALAATPSTGQPYTWQRVIDRAATYRVVAQRDGYVVPLQTERGQPSIQLDIAAALPQLVLDQQSPLKETVQLSVSGASDALSVLYFADVDGFADSTTGPSFGTTWNSRTKTDGNHVLYANVTYSSGMTIELPRRTVQVDNPSVAVNLFSNGNQVENKLTLEALATSQAGISQVEFFVNGTPLAVVTTPIITDIFSYTYDTSGLPTGPATFKAVATDNAGEQAESTKTFNIIHAPAVSLVVPTDGAIVRGTLNVIGTVTDDQPGTVVRATLGDIPLFETGGGSLAQDYSLAAVTPGQYTLRLQARDAGGVITTLERAVIVTAVTAFDYQFVATYPSAQVSLLDTDGGQLIYRVPGNTVRRRSPGGEDVSLANTAQITNPLNHVDPRLGSQWHLSGGYVTTAGTQDGRAPAIFLWDPSGNQSESAYTFQNGEFADFLKSKLHGSWLVWGSDRLFLRNLATSAPDIGPIGANIRGHALVTTPGSEKLFFGRDGATSGHSDLFVYDLTSATTTQLTPGDAAYLRPQADATQVAWESVLPLGNIHGSEFRLHVAPVSNPTASVQRSATMTRFVVADGLVAWTERLSNAIALKVYDGSNETLVSQASAVTLYSTSDGSVVFGESGKLYIWNSAQGKRLLLEVLPKELVMADHDIYVTTGAAGVTVLRAIY